MQCMYAVQRGVVEVPVCYADMGEGHIEWGVLMAASH
jgi:hypothetical protein